MCNNVNATDNTEISPIAYTVETPRGEHPLLQWKRSSPPVNHGPGRPTDSPWSLLYASVDNNNTTVGHLSREFSRLLWHFPTHRGEVNAEGDSALHLFKAENPYYMMLHGKKLVVRARDIIAGENNTE